MKKWFIAIFLFAISASLFAQPAPKELSAEQKKEIIEIVAERLSKNYILPEIAKKYSDHIKSRLKSGAYDRISYAHVFADSVKSDLYKVYKDKHLGVSYNPNMEQNLMNMEKGTAPSSNSHGNPAMEKKMNAAFKNVSIRPGNIGYVRFDGFVNPTEITKKAVDQALAFVANTDALIIDLRYNGGGSPKMVEYISSYLFDKPTHINSLYQRDSDKTTEYGQVLSLLTCQMCRYTSLRVTTLFLPLKNLPIT